MVALVHLEGICQLFQALLRLHTEDLIRDVRADLQARGKGEGERGKEGRGMVKCLIYTHTGILGHEILIRKLNSAEVLRRAGPIVASMNLLWNPSIADTLGTW